MIPLQAFPPARRGDAKRTLRPEKAVRRAGFGGSGLPCQNWFKTREFLGVFERSNSRGCQHKVLGSFPVTVSA